MARVLIRNLETDLRAQLQKRAKQNGRALAEEVREILTDAVKDEPDEEVVLGTRTRHRSARMDLKGKRAKHQSEKTR
jgi:plasmid stability protein